MRSLPPVRWLDRGTSPGAFDRLAVVSLVALYINVLSGALVRVTSSGLGCPNWPQCSDQKSLPQLSGHQLAEFGNRVLALLVIIATVMLLVSAKRAHGRNQLDRRLAYVVGLGTIAQGPLGGVTVLTGLNPIAVMTHFLLAVVVIAAASVLVVDTRGWSRTWERPAWVGTGGWVLALWALALVTSGAVATASGTHPGDRSDIPRLTNLLDAAYIHVRVAVSFVAALAVGLWLLQRIAAPPRRIARASVAVVALTGTQIVFGEWQWRTQLPWYLTLLHVFTATLLWIAVVGWARMLGPAPAEARAPEAVGRTALAD